MQHASQMCLSSLEWQSFPVCTSSCNRWNWNTFSRCLVIEDGGRVHCDRSVSGPNRSRAEAPLGLFRLEVSPYWARARSQSNLKKKEENELRNIHLNPIQSSSYLSWLLVFHYFPLHIIQLRTPSDLTTDSPDKRFFHQIYVESYSSSFNFFHIYWLVKAEALTGLADSQWPPPDQLCISRP